MPRLAVALASALVAHQRQSPARIVSTSPSITETLFALGLGDRVVGVSTYCRYPTGVATLPKVGTFLKPDVEIDRADSSRIWCSCTPGRTRPRRSCGAWHPHRSRRSRFAAERLLDDPADRRRRGRRRTGASAWSRTSRAARSRQGVGRRPAAAKHPDHRRPSHRDAHRHHRRRPGFLPARHRRACRRHERAGVGAAGVSADLDGDGHQPGPGRDRRRRRDGRVAGGFRRGAARSTEALWRARRW